MDTGLEIINKTKGKLPSLPFVNAKKAVLGEKYELSLVFVSPAFSRKLNKKWREKDKPTNILSFPLSKNSGEIFICKDVAKKEAKNFEKNLKEFIIFLFIHGMLHLKGLDHSKKMENLEQKHFLKIKNLIK